MKNKIKQDLKKYERNLSKTAFSIIKNHVQNAVENNFNSYVSATLTNQTFNNLLRELIPNK